MNDANDTTPTPVDDYIAAYPPQVQHILHTIRNIIREVAPDAEESISYGVPAYKWHGPLIYFAAFAKHISVYPAPRGYPQWQEELSAYKGGKGTVQFPLNKPIPYDLIRRIAQFRVQENRKKKAQKS